MQRVHWLLAVASFKSYCVAANAAPAPTPCAKPSRLKRTELTGLFGEVSVSVPVNGCCTCRIEPGTSAAPPPAGSGNTIQPPCQEVTPEQVSPLAEVQMATGCPSLIASARAYIRSPTSELSSADMR